MDTDIKDILEIEKGSQSPQLSKEIIMGTVKVNKSIHYIIIIYLCIFIRFVKVS